VVAFLILSATIAVRAPWNEAYPVASYEGQQDGVLLTMKSGLLKLQVCTYRIVRILYTPTSFFSNRPDCVILKSTGSLTRWATDSVGDSVVRETPTLRLMVNKRDGLMTFADSWGTKLFGDYSRILTTVEVNGEKIWHAEVFSILWGSSEGFYGLGGHQLASGTTWVKVSMSLRL
jgi:hypothetical protein